MKKIISILLSAVLLILCAVPAFASDERMITPDDAGFDFSYMPSVDDEYRSMIHSDYYKLYHNDIFIHEYETMSDPQALGYFEEKLLDALTDNTYTYASIVFKEAESEVDYDEYNLRLLEKYFSSDEILYVADSVPMAVVKLSADKAQNVKNDENTVYILDAFFRTNYLVNFLYGGAAMGDILQSGNTDVNSADARYILRFSAGLEKLSSPSKSIYFKGDMNFDGHITSADARMILRTAAGLEKAVSISFPYADYWNDLG